MLQSNVSVYVISYDKCAFHQAWHFMIYSMLALFLEIRIAHIKWIWHFILYFVVIDDAKHSSFFCYLKKIKASNFVWKLFWRKIKMITSKKINTNLKRLFSVLGFIIGLDYLFTIYEGFFVVNGNNLITIFASHSFF